MVVDRVGERMLEGGGVVVAAAQLSVAVKEVGEVVVVVTVAEATIVAVEEPPPPPPLPSPPPPSPPQPPSSPSPPHGGPGVPLPSNATDPLPCPQTVGAFVPTVCPKQSGHLSRLFRLFGPYCPQTVGVSRLFAPNSRDTPAVVSLKSVQKPMENEHF